MAGVGTMWAFRSLPTHIVLLLYISKCILTLFYPTALDYSVQFWEDLFFFIMVILSLMHTLIYEIFDLQSDSQVFTNKSQIRGWCWEALSWHTAHILVTCGVCFCGLTHIWLIGIIVICAGSFQWWNCTQATWDKVFLLKRAASSTTTAPHAVTSSLSTKLSLEWGDTRIKKKKGISIHILNFLKIRLFSVRNIGSIHCFFFSLLSLKIQ